MVQRLKLVLESQRLRLVLKTALFGFLLCLILMIPNFFSNRYDIVVFIFFITAFYIILALKEFVLVKRAWWHYSLTISLLYLATFVASIMVSQDNFFSI